MPKYNTNATLPTYSYSLLKIAQSESVPIMSAGRAKRPRPSAPGIVDGETKLHAFMLPKADAVSIAKRQKRLESKARTAQRKATAAAAAVEGAFYTCATVTAGAAVETFDPTAQADGARFLTAYIPPYARRFLRASP